MTDTDTAATSNEDRPGYVRRVGAELRPLLACSHALAALVTGTQALTARAWDWCAGAGTWPGAGKRGLGLLAGAAAAVVTVNHHPEVGIPVVVCAWCVAAWMHAPDQEPEEQLAEGPGEQPGAAPEDVVDAVLDWVRNVIGTSNGIHLADLLAHAHAHGLLTDLDISGFRTALEQHRIPVREQLKVSGRNRPGIHRDDLPKPLPHEDGQEEAITDLPAI